MTRTEGRERAPLVPERLVEVVRERLGGGHRVRRSLSGWGRLSIDRPLPFLCVYRRPFDHDDSETERLMVTEAAYLLAPGDRRARGGVARLAETIAEAMIGRFGGFLLLELWTAPETGGARAEETPSFRVLTASLAAGDPTVRNLADALAEIPLRPPPLDVCVEAVGAVHPPELPPLLDAARLRDPRCHVIGLEMQPVYRQAGTGVPYPVVHETLRRGLALALRRTFYHFALTHTTQEPRHFHALGRRGAVKYAWEADAALAEIGSGFEFLLQVTPTNAPAAWQRFRAAGRRRPPVFDYRPLVVDAATAKRRLYEIRLDRIEDPTLAYLLEDVRDEMDRKITMLTDRNTTRFLHGSQQVYGGVEPSLLALAEELLVRIGPDERDAGDSTLDAGAFAARAEHELAHYRTQAPGLGATVQVREDVSGLMVSRGHLLIGSDTTIPESRVDALLQHEVGTHVVTYFNGSEQPLRQLATGLAGYEALQEGIGVLSEWFVGALSRPRLRLLAGRVLATHDLIQGADFIETFERLTAGHGFREESAFTIAMRVHRSGGLTKDAVYLRGLVALLEHLRTGGEMEPLLVGKIALGHVPIIQELRWREVLRPPALLPRYLSTSRGTERLRIVRRGLGVLDLLTEVPA